MKQYVQIYIDLPKQIKASIWFLICSFIQKAISIITTPIFTRIMNASEYGEYNVFLSWLSIITVIVSLNLFYEVFEQGIVKFSNEREVFASSMQGLELTLICIWGCLYGLLHEWWNKLFSLNTIQMIMLFLIIWTTAIYNFWAVEQRAKYEYKKLVIITLITSFLIPFTGIILVTISKDKVTARIVSMAIVQLLSYLGLFIVQEKKGKVFYHRFFWKYALSMNIVLIPHYLSQTVLNSADRIMISRLVGENEAGIYSLAYSISLVMAIFNLTLNQTIGPWYFNKIKDKSIEEIGKIVYPSMMLIAFVNIGLIMFAPEIVKIFAPKSYYDAKWIIPPIAMSVFFTFLYDIFCKFEFYYEKTKTIAVITLIGALLNIVLNVFFIRMFGYRAAAYTTLICYIVYAGLHYISMAHICKIELCGIQPFNVKKIAVISDLFLIAGFMIQISYNSIILRISIIVVSFIILIVWRKRIVNYFKSMYYIRKNKLI